MSWCFEQKSKKHVDEEHDCTAVCAVNSFRCYFLLGLLGQREAFLPLTEAVGRSLLKSLVRRQISKELPSPRPWLATSGGDS